jgi:hypothetical protein
MYTNEAGFDVFQTALKQDALNSGLTLQQILETDLCKVKDSTLLSFDAMVTRETGRVELIHLKN